MKIDKGIKTRSILIPKNVKEQKILALTRYRNMKEVINDPKISQIGGESTAVVLFKINDKNRDAVLHKEYPYKLNLVGALIWENLKEKMTIKEIAKTISKSFDVKYITALKDIEKFVKELHRERLIIIKDR